jgi:hypothetical protein
MARAWPRWRGPTHLGIGAELASAASGRRRPVGVVRTPPAWWLMLTAVSGSAHARAPVGWRRWSSAIRGSIPGDQLRAPLQSLDSGTHSARSRRPPACAPGPSSRLQSRRRMAGCAVGIAGADAYERAPLGLRAETTRAASRRQWATLPLAGGCRDRLRQGLPERRRAATSDQPGRSRRLRTTRCRGRSWSRIASTHASG